MHECHLAELCEECITAKAFLCILAVEAVAFIVVMIVRAVREEWDEIKSQLYALRCDNVRAQAQLKSMRSDLEHFATIAVKRKEK